jgi:hypothetical protein
VPVGAVDSKIAVEEGPGHVRCRSLGHACAFLSIQ